MSTVNSATPEATLPAPPGQAALDRAEAAMMEKVGWFRRLIIRGERKLSKLSTKNNFWHRLLARIYLPLAYRSGIKFAKGDESTFSVVLPFKKFNKNWYNAMAGGALLGNAEVAGGMYVFKAAGADYAVVCKHLEYKFMRPCVGPAVYQITPQEDLDALVAQGGEFNVTLDMDIVQMVRTGTRSHERRVGTCTATFHVTPKAHIRARKAARKARDAARAERKANALADANA